MKRLSTLLAVSVLPLLTLTATITNAATVGPLETVTEFNDYRGGGITITPAGRILVSMHPLDAPAVKVVEVMANGSKQPFPTADWADGPEKGEVGFTSVIGIHSDSNGIVWVLDMGSDKTPAQLIAWDTVKNTHHKTIKITKSALVNNSFIQDFVIDEKNGKIYIADMTFGNFQGATKPAIIVVDLKTSESTRILEGISAFMPLDRDIVIEASLLASKSPEGKTTKLRFGLNPIAIDDKNEWVYFGAFTGDKIYRIPAASLADRHLSDKKRESQIEEFGPKNPSDGIAFWPGGGILVTDLENNAVGLTTKDKYEVLVQDKLLSWPDSFAVSNGWVYITQDQLHQHPAFSQGLGNAKPPYKLMRFRFSH